MTLNLKYFMVSLFALVAFVPTSNVLVAQQNSGYSFAVGFYNLENLFDTIDDPYTNDEEYLPNSSLKWETKKYTSKIKAMSYVISQMPTNLAILGVAEVENKTVLKDLVNAPLIADRELGFIHFDGPDYRGIDVALLYNPHIFVPSSASSHKMRSESADFVTRDQLVVTGRLGGEEINLIVVHWPSRRGGEEHSTPLRIEAAKTTKMLIDSIYDINRDAKIIVMGDFNDDPVDVSIEKYLDAKGEKQKTNLQEIYNPFHKLYKYGIGSLGYKDQWNLFDQIMVSFSLLPKDKDDFNSIKFIKAEVFNKDFLVQQTGKYRGYPRRTHAGGVWTEGFSDHFPVLIWLGETYRSDYVR